MRARSVGRSGCQSMNRRTSLNSGLSSRQWDYGIEKTERVFLNGRIISECHAQPSDGLTKLMVVVGALSDGSAAGAAARPLFNTAAAAAEVSGDGRRVSRLTDPLRPRSRRIVGHCWSTVCTFFCPSPQRRGRSAALELAIYLSTLFGVPSLRT
jgi:hypothetical protein